MANRNSEKLSFWRLMAFAVPNGPMFALVMPLSIFIPAYYASELGLGLATVGTVFMIGRLWDVVTDPVAGILMDRLQDRIPRARWLQIGCPIVLLGTYLLFFVKAPANAGNLLGWLLVFYVGWTLMVTSLYSWGAELSMDYHERSRIMGALQIANVAGTVLVLIVPALVEALTSGESQIATLRVKAMGAFVLILMPLSLLVSALWAPRGQVRSPKHLSFSVAAKAVLTNGPFARLATVEALNGLSLGVITSLAVFFIERVLGHEGLAAVTMLVLLTGNLVAVPAWIYLAGRFGKHRMAATAAMIAIGVHICAIFLPAGNLPMMFALFVVLGATIGAGQFLPRAMLADVIDRDRLATGDERAGLFYAFVTTAGKTGLALGIGLSLILSDLFGFNPQADSMVGAADDSRGLLAVRLIVVLLPMVPNVLNILLLWNFPLGPRQQAEMRRRLETDQDHRPVQPGLRPSQTEEDSNIAGPSMG